MSVAQAKTEVPAHFDDVAGRYDLLTRLNPGYLKHLRWSAERLALPTDATLLDLCCGTGLSTDALARAYPNATITGLDASQGMLSIAQSKGYGSARTSFILGDATDPAAAGVPQGAFDGILMAYGIRNVPEPDRCLQNVLSLLKPGGVICFHEYSVADSRISQAVWNAVTCAVVIPLGLVTTPKSPIYRYLRRSVLAFDGVRAFEARLRRAGFVDVRTMPMDGWQRGVVHSFLARRP
jgi:ubiquinone/menaquinone biosynthesis C-methylase UbiE